MSREEAKGTEIPRLDLSVIFPVFNERDSLPPLLDELEPALRALGISFEVICVDDKSTDDSVEVLRGLQKDKPYLRVIQHRINCGESAAFVTGFERARGDIIVTMDADLQHDPADIPALLKALDAGTDAVCGIRRKRLDNFVRRMSSRIANVYRNAITGDRIADAGCTFRAMRREALRELPVFNGLHRFLPTILRLQGYTVKEMSIHHRPRTHGVAKYGVGNRLWRGIRDCFAIRWYRARCVPARRVDPDSEKQ